jgi:hypothetical protein
VLAGLLATGIARNLRRRPTEERAEGHEGIAATPD